VTQRGSLLPAGRLPGIDRALTPTEADMLTNYMNLLRKWQRTQRLVGSTEPAWLVENVIIDSLCFFKGLPPGARRIADVGSGAGVPGIPMAIVRGDLKFALIESRLRRASFLSTCVRELGLSQTEVISRRVEDLEQSHDRVFDAVVLRCAGDMSKLLPVVMPLVTDHGVVIASARPEDHESGREEIVEVPRTNAPARRLRLWRRTNFGY
jgi:16S rRNA (guanine527-N7)-methyltransferase